MLARFQLIRPLNLLFIALGQIGLFVNFLSPTPDKVYQAFMFCFSTLLCAAAGYVVNDIFDKKIDLINRPKRPIPSGNISILNAWVFYFTLLVSSIAVAYFSNIQAWWQMLLIMSIALFLYSWFIKRMAIAGNLLVSACLALVFALCALLFDEAYPLISELAGFAFCATFIREIFKSIEDHKGDAANGCRTMPVLLGVQTSMRVCGVLCLLFGVGLLGYMGFSFNQLTNNMIWVSVFALSGLTFLYIGMQAIRKPTEISANKFSLLVKINMLLVLLAVYFW